MPAQSREFENNGMFNIWTFYPFPTTTLPHHHPTVPLDEQISQSFFFFVETLRKKTLLFLIFFLGSLKNRFLLVICQGHSFANVNYRRYSDVILHFTGTHTKLTISGGHLIAFAFSPSASIAATISYHQIIMIRGLPLSSYQLDTTRLVGRVKQWGSEFSHTCIQHGGHEDTMVQMICFRRKYKLWLARVNGFSNSPSLPQSFCLGVCNRTSGSRDICRKRREFKRSSWHLDASTGRWTIWLFYFRVTSLGSFTSSFAPIYF